MKLFIALLANEVHGRDARREVSHVAMATHPLKALPGAPIECVTPLSCSVSKRFYLSVMNLFILELSLK